MDSTNTTEAARRDGSALEREVMQHECPHDQGIQTWRMGDGRGAGLWSCIACARKFVPIDLAMEKDAERYRWLREHGDGHCTEKDGYGGQTLRMGEYLDTAVDAAMAAARDAGAA